MALATFEGNDPKGGGEEVEKDIDKKNNDFGAEVDKY